MAAFGGDAGNVTVFGQVRWRGLHCSIAHYADGSRAVS